VTDLASFIAGIGIGAVTTLVLVILAFAISKKTTPRSDIDWGHGE
jgi:hypothetical protein